MASRRRSAAPAVSLFPFLSVLACVIGTLTLMIAAVALGQMGGQGVLDRVRALEREAAAEAAEAAAVRERLASSRALVEQVESAREELDAAERELDETAREERRVARRSERADALQREQDALRARLADLQGELGDQRQSLAELASDDDARNQPIVLKPLGSATGLKPYFIECRLNEIVVYDARHRPQMWVPVDSIQRSWDFRRFVDRLRQEPDATVVLLVRPDGVDVSREARRALGNKVRFGLSPLPGWGDLDFSAVEAGRRDGEGT